MNELLKNGLSVDILEKLSYKSNLNLSLVNSLRRFDKKSLFEEIEKMIEFYRLSYELEGIELDYRIKSKDSCLRKYDKFYPEMRLEKTINDMLGFRMLVDNYEDLLEETSLSLFRVATMSKGKSNDDGYRGVHVYFQINHFHYPIEIQANTYYDRQMNNWLHKYLYKKGYANDVGAKLRTLYEEGKIQNEKIFEEMLRNVLFNCKKI